MLFSGKKNVFKLFGCLKIHFTENQFRYLVRSNIFTENALHSQATQFSIHFLSCKHVDNESIPHSFTKETKPSKKRKSNLVKLRSRSGGEGEIGGKIERRRDRRWDRSNKIERRGAVIDDQRGAIIGLELGLWSPAKSLLPLSLRSGLSLSLCGNTLKWKSELKSFSACEALFYDQTENIFNLTQFTGPTKHAIFRKMISEFRLKSKQMDPWSQIGSFYYEFVWVSCFLLGGPFSIVGTCGWEGDPWLDLTLRDTNLPFFFIFFIIIIVFFFFSVKECTTARVHWPNFIQSLIWVFMFWHVVNNNNNNNLNKRHN